MEALRHWEEEHPDRCVRTLDDGSFFGFTEVAQGYLGRFTRFLLIPAVRDAQQDGTEGRGSPITALMDLVVRSALARRAELVEFKQEVENRYREIMNPEGMPELNALEQRLRSSLQTFVPGSGLSVVWQPSANFSLPMPQADVKLIEHDYASPVANAGHGLQRAFVLSILQNLALAEIQSSATSSEAENAPPLPSLVLAIEEPELYQHPNRQRHLAKVLRDLAEGSIPGAVRKTQILYATHSPFFVSIDSFHQVRVLRKVCAAEGKPKVTQVVHFSGDSAAEELHRAEDDPKPPGYTWHTLQARLQAVMTTEMAEGFFADVAVLVEGEEDRAALLAAAARKGYHLEADGIAIIPCDGKTNLDKPLVIFRGFGIATYVIWDGDAGTNGAEPVHNRRLLRLLGEPVVDWPQTTVRATFACFHKTLHDEIKDALDGDCYDTLMKECEQEFAIPKRKHAIKNPAVVRRLLDLAAEHGKPVQILEEIVDAIMRRKQA
ncbi:MAG: AAA family ATPase [Sphaerobacter sp.]|nr:AAA family ATPase [Sphaerobacter sp.]